MIFDSTSSLGGTLAGLNDWAFSSLGGIVGFMGEVMFRCRVPIGPKQQRMDGRFLGPGIGLGILGLLTPFGSACAPPTRETAAGDNA